SAGPVATPASADVDGTGKATFTVTSTHAGANGYAFNVTDYVPPQYGSTSQFGLTVQVTFAAVGGSAPSGSGSGTLPTSSGIKAGPLTLSAPAPGDPGGKADLTTT